MHWQWRNWPRVGCSIATCYAAQHTSRLVLGLEAQPHLVRAGTGEMEDTILHLSSAGSTQSRPQTLAVAGPGSGG
jgi:hypothetical protein